MKKITETPTGIKLVLVEAILMPNGEVICKGKPVGWLDGALYGLVYEYPEIKKQTERRAA